MRRAGVLAFCVVGAPEALAQSETPQPVTVGASYVTDLIANVDGGERRGLAWLGRADLTVSVDGSVFGWDGGEAFVDVLAVQRPDFSGRYVGDAQTVSNVQADSALRPIEAWIAGPLGGGVSLKLGMVDLNSEFDVQAVGKHFLNSSHGIGPDFSQSGVNGPSIFPAGATAVMLRYEDEAWAVRLGVFDAVAGSTRNPRRAVFRVPGAKGALLVGEIDRKLAGGGEIQLGAWRYTPKFAKLDPSAPGEDVSQGAYVMVEGPLATPGETKLEGWVRVGVASAEVNEIDAYLGGGLSVGDEAQRLGLAVAHARRGRAARRAANAAGEGSDRAETAIELSYAHRLTPGVTVQPDLQYVINPGWHPGRRDATVIGVRFSLAWSSD